MTILPIIIAPDPRLKEKSAPVEKITPEILSLMEDMLDTMYASNGIGLAAVQVGVLKRIIVVDTEWGSPRYREEGVPRTEGFAPGNPIRMINPEVIAASPEFSSYNEGCLSFPGQYSDVDRPATVTIRYMDEHGKAQTLKAEGLLATCVQHEMDHLEGIVFVDHISRLKREMILKRLKKEKSQHHIHGDHCNH
jgi:peptide deformylase